MFYESGTPTLEKCISTENSNLWNNTNSQIALSSDGTGSPTVIQTSLYLANTYYKLDNNKRFNLTGYLYPSEVAQEVLIQNVNSHTNLQLLCRISSHTSQILVSKWPHTVRKRHDYKDYRTANPDTDSEHHEQLRYVPIQRCSE
jgi:hypothetical protein